MFLTIRKDFDLATHLVIAVGIDYVSEVEQDARDMLDKIVNARLESCNAMGNYGSITGDTERTYFRTKTTLSVYTITEYGNDCCLYLYEQRDVKSQAQDDMTYDEAVAMACKGLSRMAGITSEQAKEVIACFGYEVNGKPVMLTHPSIPGPNMSPDEFHNKYLGIWGKE